MVGMHDIKNRISNQIIYFLNKYNEQDNEGSMLHSVIYGPPGCGKTHVATILAKIYSHLGYLKKNKVTYGSRSSFIADYLGQTTNKTKKFLEKAKGGVLIIDEIYSLGPSSESTSSDSYSKECIDCINQFLSENKKDLLCIVMGYEKDVQSCFFDVNEGLSRRFPFRYTVEQYTPQQLFEIFQVQIKRNNWKINPFALKNIKAHLVSEFTTHKNLFNNAGGDTENLLFYCKIQRALNTFDPNSDKIENKFSLAFDDIKFGFEQFKKNKQEILNKKNVSDPPEHMYL
jgi:SpoVK/Ycf46/Vps4 family AAA+-type ATPase